MKTLIHDESNAILIKPYINIEILIWLATFPIYALVSSLAIISGFAWIVVAYLFAKLADFIYPQFLKYFRKMDIKSIIKRVIDITYSSITLFIIAPAFSLTCLAVKLDDRSSIFFGSPRIGKDRKQFLMLKFRTIKELGKSSPNADWRVSRIGRILRRASLDELPVLLNVVRGDMSIVGPRPWTEREIEFLDSHYGKDIESILGIKPGITGLWQLAASQSKSIKDKVVLDKEYADNWSVWMDIKIMVKTMIYVFQSK